MEAKSEESSLKDELSDSQKSGKQRISKAAEYFQQLTGNKEGVDELTKRVLSSHVSY